MLFPGDQGTILIRKTGLSSWVSVPSPAPLPHSQLEHAYLYWTCTLGSLIKTSFQERIPVPKNSKFESHSSNPTVLFKRLKQLRHQEAKSRQKWGEEPGLPTTLTLYSWFKLPWTWLTADLGLTTHSYLSGLPQPLVLLVRKWSNGFQFGACLLSVLISLLMQISCPWTLANPMADLPDPVLPPHPLPLHTTQVCIDFGGPGNCQNTPANMGCNRLQ